MIPQIYHTVIYPAKIPNPYQKNEMVFDPIYIIPGYDIISLDMEYPMEYIIPFRPVSKRRRIKISIIYKYIIVRDIIFKDL